MRFGNAYDTEVIKLNWSSGEGAGKDGRAAGNGCLFFVKDNHPDCRFGIFGTPNFAFDFPFAWICRANLQSEVEPVTGVPIEWRVGFC